MTHTPTHRRRRGFTLVEAVICIGIVGVMVAPTLYVVGASRTTRLRSENHARAASLADALLAEVMAKPYADPDSPHAPLGPNGGEGSGGGRLNFDDVDDFDGWNASPPIRPNGAPIGGVGGLTRCVSVGYVSPDDMDTYVPTDTGLKRITVVVKRGDAVLAELNALRTSARPDPQSELE